MNILIKNLIIKNIVNFLENNNDDILDNISDKAIRNCFDKTRDFFIEIKHLKKELLTIKTENEELKKKLEIQKDK